VNVKQVVGVKVSQQIIVWQWDHWLLYSGRLLYK